MSERKAGWYWVEHDHWGRWQCAHWDGQGWHLLGISEPLHTAKMTRVGDRIPTPDEPWQCAPKRMDRAMMSSAIPNDQCEFPDYRAQEDEMQARYIRALSAAPSPNDTPSHTSETTGNQELTK